VGRRRGALIGAIAAGLLGCGAGGAIEAARPASGAALPGTTSRAEAERDRPLEAVDAGATDEAPRARDEAPRVPADPGGAIVALAVPGFEDALVSIPAGAPAPRPLVVATHGATGSPEPHCAYWREVVGDGAFVVCPRGKRLASVASGLENTGFYYPDHLALGREVAACVAAAEARFGAAIDAKRAVYVGFSQGASMGALMLGHEPGRFARAVLVEGGVDEWSAASMAAFRGGGGARVALACGQTSCADRAPAMAKRLGRAGIEARAVRDLRSGHALAGPLAAEVARAFAWVVEGDARFAR
jgi:predicted esterase